MNKKLLAEKVSEKLGFDKKSGVAAVEAVFEIITEQLSNKETVDISGFGKFEVRERAARPGFNPRTKEAIQIEATVVPGFKAAKSLKDSVKK